METPWKSFVLKCPQHRCGNHCSQGWSVTVEPRSASLTKLIHLSGTAPTVHCSFLQAAKPSFCPSHHPARGTSSCPFYTPGCGGEVGGWVRLALCGARPRPDTRWGRCCSGRRMPNKERGSLGEGVATWPLVRSRPLDPLAGEALGSRAASVVSLRGFCSWKALAACKWLSLSQARQQTGHLAWPPYWSALPQVCCYIVTQLPPP